MEKNLAHAPSEFISRLINILFHHDNALLASGDLFGNQPYTRDKMLAIRLGQFKDFYSFELH